MARSRLAPGGLMAQWFHVYNMSPEDLKSVKTYQQVFPFVSVWRPQAGDLILIAASSPMRWTTDASLRRWNNRRLVAASTGWGFSRCRDRWIHICLAPMKRPLTRPEAASIRTIAVSRIQRTAPPVSADDGPKPGQHGRSCGGPAIHGPGDRACATDRRVRGDSFHQLAITNDRVDSVKAEWLVAHDLGLDASASRRLLLATRD